MNYFRKSDGTKVSKAYIDRQVTKAKGIKVQQQLDDDGYNFCQEDGCGRNASSGVYIDCSHDISVNDCQNSGRSELAWDLNNITMRCRPCHDKWDSPTSKDL